MKNIEFKIKTKNLKLRYYNLEDVIPVMEMSQEPLSRRWLSNQVTETVDKTTELLKYLVSEYGKVSVLLNCDFVLGIEELETGLLVGHVGLSPFKNDIEVGFGISTLHQGKGYATEAVLAVSQWALSDCGLSSIVGLVDIKNLGSKRVLEKSGFIHEETFPGKDYSKENECCVYRKRIRIDD